MAKPANLLAFDGVVGEMNKMIREKEYLEQPEGHAISQLCSQWETSIRYKVKPTTYAVYITVIEKHILPCLGGRQAEELNNWVLKQYLQEKQREELSWSTLRLIVFLLKRILQMGEEKGIGTAEKLCFYIPKYKKTYMRTLGQENSEKLLHYLNGSGESFELGMLICICTGIRVGELCGLQWKDVNWLRGTIQINRTVSRIRNLDTEGIAKETLSKTIIYIGTPKTGTSVREIPLPDFLVLKMQRYKKGDACYILTGISKCMEPRGVQRKFKNLLRKCGVPDINIHSLRHSFASRWIENGFDNKALSEILGHSSVKVTMDIYVHSDLKQKKSYMNRMV